MTPEQKLLAGEELFLYACSITMAGIRNQFPEADEAERKRILQSRIDLQRKLDEMDNPNDSGSKSHGPGSCCADGMEHPCMLMQSAK